MKYRYVESNSVGSAHELGTLMIPDRTEDFVRTDHARHSFWSTTKLHSIIKSIKVQSPLIQSAREREREVNMAYSTRLNYLQFLGSCANK